MRAGRHLFLESLEERRLLSTDVVLTSIGRREPRIGLLPVFYSPTTEIVVAGGHLSRKRRIVPRTSRSSAIKPTVFWILPFGNGGVVTTPIGRYGDWARAAVPYPANGDQILLGGGASARWDLDFGLARYDPDGSLDRQFGRKGKVQTDLGGNDRLHDVVVQDGNIIAAGSHQRQRRLPVRARSLHVHGPTRFQLRRGCHG